MPHKQRHNIRLPLPLCAPRWLAVVLFAVSMAWMEAATVVYLRRLVGRIEPYQADPLPLDPLLGGTELVREAATMVMLAAAGWLAGGTARTRFGYWLLAFGVWDIFYYVCLAVIGPWPRSVWDWDVLFLLPLPWWGPVAAPVSIALLMVAAGTLVTQFGSPEGTLWPTRRAWAPNLAGTALALYLFNADALRALNGGFDGVRTVLPASFNWPLFLVALGLMSVPVVDVLAQLPGRKGPIEAAASAE